MSSETLYELKKEAIENQIKFERMKIERDTLYQELMKVSSKLEKVKDENYDLRIQLKKKQDTQLTPYIHTILYDWEEVYSVQDVSANLWTEDLPLFHDETKYYQTFGGGDEGGYFVRKEKVWKVRRGWFQPWKIEKLDNVVLEYEKEDEMAGKTAQCRLIEVVDITETYKINKQHYLWGNAIEIVKCLRDGLGRDGDASYKDLCLGIILDHFHYINKYLDLLPEDTAPTYREVLNDLYKDKNKEDEEGSEKDDSDSSETE